MGGVFSTVDVNTIAAFLADQQIRNISQAPQVDCIVLCVSAILHCAETVFQALQLRPDLAKTLIICGGKGHSTKLLYDAVAKHPKYAFLAREIRGLPEARVMEIIYEECFKRGGVEAEDEVCRVLIEDRSTNCGANAVETRRVLRENGVPPPRSCIIVQDPTMSRRTVASFQKAFEDLDVPPVFTSCPTFIPRVRLIDRKVGYDITGIESKELWATDRFLELVLGEVPRLRDDESGYGPKGKNFIGHVDIPDDVEKAFKRLKKLKTMSVRK